MLKRRTCVKCNQLKDDTQLYVHQRQKVYKNVLPMPYCISCARDEGAKLTLAEIAVAYAATLDTLERAHE